MEPDIVLDRTQFKTFIDLIKLTSVSAECNDCDIEKGIVRQKNNDRYWIIEMDMTSIIGDHSLAFSSAKEKVNLFGSFQLDINDLSKKPDNENVEIYIEEKKYLIVDEFSSLTVRKPPRTLLSNQFIELAAFEKTITIREEDLVFEKEIESHLAVRMKSVVESMENVMLICNMNDNEATMSIESKDKHSKFTVIRGISLNKNISKCNFSLHCLPFIMDTGSDIKMSAYSRGKDTLLVKSDFSLNSIPITSYTQVKLIDG